MARRILRLPHTLMVILDRVVDTRATPLAYLVLLHNLIFALGFIIFDRGGVQETVLARIGIPFGVEFWAACLFAGVLTIWLGLLRRTHKVVMIGAMLAFATWLAAAITYFVGSAHFQSSLAVVTALQYAYFFVGAGLDRLWDYTPVDNGKSSMLG